eukprot:308811-Pelagomonas_calceolata.AAC.5
MRPACMRASHLCACGHKNNAGVAAWGMATTPHIWVCAGMASMQHGLPVRVHNDPFTSKPAQESVRYCVLLLP